MAETVNSLVLFLALCAIVRRATSDTVLVSALHLAQTVIITLLVSLLAHIA